MAQQANQRDMSDVQSTSCVSGLAHETLGAIVPSASTPLLRPRSVSPRPEYTPYGTKDETVVTGASRVMHKQMQVIAPSLGEHISALQVQLSATAMLLLSQVAQANQSMQQTQIVAGEALERMSAAREQTTQL